MKITKRKSILFLAFMMLSIPGCVELPRSHIRIFEPEKPLSDLNIKPDVHLSIDYLYDGFKEDVISFVEKRQFFGSFSCAYLKDDNESEWKGREYVIKLNFSEKAENDSFPNKMIFGLKAVASATTFGILPMPYAKYYVMSGVVYNTENNMVYDYSAEGSSYALVANSTEHVMVWTKRGFPPSLALSMAEEVLTNIARELSLRDPVKNESE